MSNRARARPKPRSPRKPGLPGFGGSGPGPDDLVIHTDPGCDRPEHRQGIHALMIGDHDGDVYVRVINGVAGYYGTLPCGCTYRLTTADRA